MMKISTNQRSLLQRIKYIDDISAKNTQILVTAFGQAKLASERVNDAKHLKILAENAQKQASDILQSLLSIESHLAPEDRLGHPEFTERWPALDVLYQREQTKPPHEAITTPERSALDPPKVTVCEETGIGFAELARVPSATISTPISGSPDKSEVIDLLKTISKSLQPSEHAPITVESNKGSSSKAKSEPDEISKVDVQE
ncbi:hypothetical protein CLU79DRAFT_516991 [Phycomyces nitens]|nr:hypothetical protein CLU79DRAFT_516991 [Phycomyces nitens]